MVARDGKYAMDEVVCIQLPAEIWTALDPVVDCLSSTQEKGGRSCEHFSWPDWRRPLQHHVDSTVHRGLGHLPHVFRDFIFERDAVFRVLRIRVGQRWREGGVNEDDTGNTELGPLAALEDQVRHLNSENSSEGPPCRLICQY